MNVQSRRLVVEFTKMNGAGNDFIVVDNRFYNFDARELSELAVKVCERRIGIGADGILALADPGEQDVDFRMIYFNADGSRASMCGNGARCLSRFARLAGVGQEEMRFSSDAGLYSVLVPEQPDQDVILFVPPYRDYHSKPKAGSLPELQHIRAEDIDYIWTGTEHLVCWVEDADVIDIPKLGPLLRKKSLLAPAGANVNFASRPKSSSDAIRVRTFEKGVEAETLACGTGALAVSISATRRGLTSSNPVAISMDGGTLSIGYSGDIAAPTQLTLSGPADVVYRGTFEI